MDDTELEDLDTFDVVDENKSPPATVPVTGEVVQDLDALLMFYQAKVPEFMLVWPQNTPRM
jgi:hypothetical protein